MKPYRQITDDKKNVVREDAPRYNSPEELEDARLLEAMNKSDMEKFRLFTKMLRTNAMYKRAVITHKK